jgi:hypothetical protein
MSLAQAVFFDRDGTLMEEVGYCASPELVRVFPGVPEALRNLKQPVSTSLLLPTRAASPAACLPWNNTKLFRRSFSGK